MRSDGFVVRDAGVVALHLFSWRGMLQEGPRARQPGPRSGTQRIPESRRAPMGQRIHETSVRPRGGGTRPHPRGASSW